ncbi:hypothetical protein V2J09_010661 [Rumex salicifolius]
MEMESSRRPSFDRSRELGLKRPRLAEEPSINNRAFQQKQQRTANSGAAVASSSPRFRVNNDRDRDSDEPLRGTYQQPNQLQQHQELVNQYKTALAELTFNSKPIITNLTIIAGENTHAAKSIAATICANIIEVPSDQKLPSLYLLDSIVKNIGRDYIKYFAAKLPEVFCKAYRQVDPPVHSSMQHLFGTWKGVFPLQSLQIIERELGFVAVGNGSSSNTPRADAQRQPHSIHVNPKYLEARRLQQSGRNVQQPQSEELRDTGHEKPVGAEFEDHEYGSGQPRIITSRLGKPNERITDHSYDKQWSSAGRGVEESISNQRNGVNARQSTSSLVPSRSANMLLRPTHSVASRSGRELPTSWKNSEEEEYMWDDLSSGVSDNVAIDNNNIQKDHWPVDGLEKLEFGGRNTNRLNQADIVSRIDRDIDPLSSEQVPFGRQRSSSWQLQEQPPVQGSDISLPRTGFQSHVGPPHAGPSGSAGSLGQRHPSGKPLISSRDPRLNFVEKEQTQANVLAQPNRKPALLSRSSDMGNPKLHDSSLGVHQNLHSDNIKKSEVQSFQKTTPIVSSIRSKLPPGQSDIEPSTGFENRVKQLGSSSGTPNAVAGQLDASALLAAVMKSGVSLGSLTAGGLSSLSTGPSQTKLPGPKLVSSPGSPPDLVSLLSKRKTDEPPLPPPSSLLNSTPTSHGPSSSSNQYSSLISSLMAKGFITEPDTPASLPPLSSKSNKQIPTTTSITQVPKAPVSSTIPPSIADKLTSSKPSQVAPKAIKPKIENLIGFEFKLDLLRQFHSSVVDGLFEDLQHSCSICGLRLKFKERLDRHLEWHALKQSEPNKSSRKWYANPANWVAGKAASDMVIFSQESDKTIEEDPEPMVPADESHCVCLLCGELFEDFYSLERDEWMFKGAVYMTISSGSSWNRGSSSQNNGQGVIVHAKCMADDSVRDLVQQANFAKMVSYLPL